MDEQLLAMIVGLMSEMTVLRAHLDACERLLAASGALSPGRRVTGGSASRP